jgi:hypothetical protein
MFTEARIAAGLHAMMREIEAPPVPLAEIRRRVAELPRERPRAAGFYLAAAAAAAIAIVTLPVVAPGFVQSLEAQIEAILRWTPPPAPPASIESTMRPHIGTLTQAQARVAFTIVAPAGLPKDVVSETIATTPTGVYSKATGSWSVGGPCVRFTYKRRGGLSLTLLADRFDPRTGPPSKYIFLDEGERNGHEVLLRRKVFTWRNGDQVMSTTEGAGFSATDIARIRSAMHGIPIPGVWPPQDGIIVKQYRLP